MAKVRCLACERHALFRVAMRFSDSVIRSSQYVAVVERINDVFGRNNVHVDFQNENQRYPAIAIIMVDVKVPNFQKRTMTEITTTIKAIVLRNLSEGGLEEGFIETYENADMIDLLPEKGVKVCKR